MTGTIIDIVITLVVAAVVLVIVSRFNMGLNVNGFGAAIIAAAAIAIVAGIVAWLLSIFNIGVSGAWLVAIVNLVIAAVVLLVADRFVPGMTVKGFGGAIIAAIAIGVVTWIVFWFLGLFGIQM